MNNLIAIKEFQSPIGTLICGANKKGICLITFKNHSRKSNLNANLISEKNSYLDQLEKELSEYFEKKRKKFTVPLDLIGTEFQKLVWNNLQKILYGTTISYQKQSIDLNNPKAIRAIARANAQNAIAIIIPCHRVIGKNGNLTGYAGGIEKKQWLLDFERS